MPDLDLVFRALRFAATAHRDQRRKGSAASPFINHPIEVAHVLVSVGGVEDEEILAAALLHDTIEDTVVEPDEVERHFGQRVRRIVEEVTDDQRLGWRERRQRAVRRAPGLSHGAALVKLADLVANVHDVAWSPPAGWSDDQRGRYLDWTERVVAGCGSVSPALVARYRELADEARSALE